MSGPTMVDWAGLIPARTHQNLPQQTLVMAAMAFFLKTTQAMEKEREGKRKFTTRVNIVQFTVDRKWAITLQHMLYWLPCERVRNRISQY